MATSIYWEGRVISVPGSYSRVDASGLETVGLGASGIVAVLGKAEGGIPVSELTEFSEIPRFTSPERMMAAYRDGQMRDVANMLFAPAKDPDILGGAQQVLGLKVNPATSSTATLNAVTLAAPSGAPQIDLESVEFGAFTEGVNVELATGTGSIGKLLTIRFEDVVETVDQLGGSNLATLQYVGGSNGYTTTTALVSSAGDVTVTATKASLGKDSDITLAAVSATATLVSTSIADTMVATIYGLVGGLPVKEAVTLNGTTPVVSSNTWDVAGILGVILASAAAGTVTVKSTGAGGNTFSLAPAVLSKGVAIVDYGYVDHTTLSLVLDGAGTSNVLLFGKSFANVALAEKIAMAGAVPVTTVASTWGLIEVIVLGAVAAARTLTLTARAARSLGATQKTLLKVQNYFNAKQKIVSTVTYGFIFDILTGNTSFEMANMDPSASAINILSPATGGLKADLYAIIAWINQNSVLVTATRSTGADRVPDNTSAPVFLSGGVEGTALFSHYQSALNLLKKGRVNSIVDLSGSPAVAAALDAHCAYMGGIGRSERDGFVGILNDDGDDVPTKTQLKAQIVDINSRHIRAFAQAITRFNDDGDKEEFLPPFGAAILAGMQAGAPVGTSLTHKYMNVAGLRQHSTWNPTDDAEEMIQAGLLFSENVEGVGRRVKRNITTHLSSNNLAFIEGSVNNAVNFAVFNLRTSLEFAVGKRGFAGTLAATRSVATGILGLQVDNTIITTFRALQIQLLMDVMDVSVELAPVIPINFVRTTVHLVNPAQAA